MSKPIALLDTSEDFAICARELAEADCLIGQLLTPLTRFTLRDPTLPWAIDNGAYARFSAAGFTSLLERERTRQHDCLFVAVPDVVGSARRTLEVFPHWRPSLEGWRIALVMQDGQQDLPIPWDEIDAVFIGGSTAFKISVYAVHIIKAAQILGKWVHVGRINDPARFANFRDLGMDSFDGSGISRFSHMRLALSGNHQEKLCLLQPQ